MGHNTATFTDYLSLFNSVVLHHFYGTGQGEPEGKAGGWREARYESCAGIHMPRKQASVIKNGSLIISIQQRGRQQDGSTHTSTHMHDNRCYSCNLKGHCANMR